MNKTFKKFLVLIITLAILTTAIYLHMTDQPKFAFLFYILAIMMVPYYLDSFGPKSRSKDKQQKTKQRGRK